MVKTLLLATVLLSGCSDFRNYEYRHTCDSGLATPWAEFDKASITRDGVIYWGAAAGSYHLYKMRPGEICKEEKRAKQ